MKRTGCLLLCLILLFAASGCGSASTAPAGKLSIVATIFPAYDWTRQILGGGIEDVELSLLLDNGVDLHSFQPSVQDMVKIAECDLLIYVGGASDKWIEDALANVADKGPTTINLLSVLGDAAKEEELVEGMQPDISDDASDETDYDEHVWLSLRNAALFCEAITNALCKLDPDRSGTFQLNSSGYIESLNLLDSEYRTMIDNARTNTLLFGDRFPFRYLTDDYGLKYYAAFVGCSAETEASFETVTFLAEKLRTLQLGAVLTIETGDDRLAKTIVETSGMTDVQILKVNSMQAVSAAEIEAGACYLDIMRDNLDTFRLALQ